MEVVNNDISAPTTTVGATADIKLIPGGDINASMIGKKRERDDVDVGSKISILPGPNTKQLKMTPTKQVENVLNTFEKAPTPTTDIVKTTTTTNIVVNKNAPSPGTSISIKHAGDNILLSSPSEQQQDGNKSAADTTLLPEQIIPEAMDIEPDTTNATSKTAAATTTTAEASLTTAVEEAIVVAPKPPIVEQTPAELAREKLQKAANALKESINDLDAKERKIQAEMDQEEEKRAHDSYLKKLAAELLSLDPITDAVTDCVIDLVADVQEMYYDESNPWDPRQDEGLNYNQLDDIDTTTGQENDDKLTKIVSKNSIPVDNHPTYYTEHFQNIFNEFTYCNVQYLALSFDDGPLGITLEAVVGRPDLYRVTDINPNGQAAKKIVLQNGDILRTVNNILVQGRDFDDVVKIIQKVPRPAVFRFSRHGWCVPLPKRPKPPKSLKERMEDLKYERLHRNLLLAREQQERLKLKAIEESNRRKEAEATTKNVCKQNKMLRAEINKHAEEQSKRDKLVDKMKSKYQKLTKQAQDAVIQRSLLSTEIARLKEELERNKSELHRSNMTRLNELNTQAVSAAVNPQKNDEMKKKLKLARSQLEQLERNTEKRRMEDARKAKILPKRFRKMIHKMLVRQLRIPYECVTGHSGRGEFAVTIENVPDYVFDAIFGTVGKGIDGGDNSKNNGVSNSSSNATIVNGTKIRKMLTSTDVFNCFGKTFRREQSITVPKPKRFVLDLATIKGDYSLALTYQTDILSLKIIGVFTCEEAVGMAATLGKNIRLGGM